ATPFTPAIWLLVAICFILLSITIYMVISKILNQRISFSLILLELFSIYIHKPSETLCKSKLTFIRVVLCVWMICALILSIGCCTKLYSILTVPRLEEPVDTVAQLVQSATLDRHYIIAEA